MVQNGITNFVSLLDNIMIGRIGTEQMSGAAIVNQLIFVYNLCIFGGVSGAGIFTAQYFGQKDHEGVRQTLRYKLWMAVILTVITIVLFLTAGDSLISMYLKGDGTAQEIRDTLIYGKQYLCLSLIHILHQTGSGRCMKAMEMSFWNPELLTGSFLHFRKLPLIMVRSFCGSVVTG